MAQDKTILGPLGDKTDFDATTVDEPLAAPAGGPATTQQWHRSPGNDHITATMAAPLLPSRQAATTMHPARRSSFMKDPSTRHSPCSETKSSTPLASIFRSHRPLRTLQASGQGRAHHPRSKSIRARQHAARSSKKRPSECRPGMLSKNDFQNCSPPPSISLIPKGCPERRHRVCPVQKARRWEDCESRQERVSRRQLASSA